MRQPLSGQLLKFTTAFQGWQPRWFIIDPRSGQLLYYLKEENKSAGMKPRGTMVLAGAVVFPSEEDQLAFTLAPAAGEAYKLRAADTRQRSVGISGFMNKFRV